MIALTHQILQLMHFWVSLNIWQGFYQNEFPHSNPKSSRSQRDVMLGSWGASFSPHHRHCMGKWKRRERVERAHMEYIEASICTASSGPAPLAWCDRWDDYDDNAASPAISCFALRVTKRESQKEEALWCANPSFIPWSRFNRFFSYLPPKEAGASTTEMGILKFWCAQSSEMMPRCESGCDCLDETSDWLMYWCWHSADRQPDQVCFLRMIKSLAKLCTLIYGARKKDARSFYWDVKNTGLEKTQAG